MRSFAKDGLGNQHGGSNEFYRTQSLLYHTQNMSHVIAEHQESFPDNTKSVPPGIVADRRLAGSRFGVFNEPAAPAALNFVSAWRGARGEGDEDGAFTQES
jgi:hypothetical protein